MLDFSLKYRPAIDTITASRDLRKYELLPAEWKITGELREVLKDTTMYFSRGTPNLAAVIPAMDHIDKVLATAADSPYQFGPSIRAALALGKNALNRYYNKTDHSEVYWIAMVLHPCHKLEYFKNTKWEGAWIQTARSIVQDEFTQSYESVEGANDEGDTEHDDDEADKQFISFLFVFGLTVPLADLFESQEHIRRFA
ncbi:hypothetical protein EDB85DRAFT_1878177 [Lactarius pseudohatsudake]|nr:hypothetical protein EDB85DRAFT_1878177 [Lactarius pseudohatsudake]